MRLKLSRFFEFAVNKSTIKLRMNLNFIHVFGMVSLNPNIHTLGLVSRCNDGMHCLFLDYDDVMLSVVLKEVRMLQRKFKIGTAVILATYEDFNVSGDAYGRYHVIFPSKHRFIHASHMMKETSCDANFKRVPQYFNHRAWVLRVLPKYANGWEKLVERPHFHDILYSETDCTISRPVYEFLVKYYGMPEWTGSYKPRMDGFHMLNVMYYQTTEGKWLVNPFKAVWKTLKAMKKNIIMYVKSFSVQLRRC